MTQSTDHRAAAETPETPGARALAAGAVGLAEHVRDPGPGGRPARAVVVVEGRGGVRVVEQARLDGGDDGRAARPRPCSRGRPQGRRGPCPSQTPRRSRRSRAVPRCVPGAAAPRTRSPGRGARTSRWPPGRPRRIVPTAPRTRRSSSFLVSESRQANPLDLREAVRDPVAWRGEGRGWLTVSLVPDLETIEGVTNSIVREFRLGNCLSDSVATAEQGVVRVVEAGPVDVLGIFGELREGLDPAGPDAQCSQQPAAGPSGCRTC